MYRLLDSPICIIGLGYVGLPLCLAFSKIYNVVGFDKNSNRINNLINGIDVTNEVKKTILKKAKSITFTDDIKKIEKCKVFIITVPTPINKYKQPDLRLLKAASKDVAKYLTPNSLVIYESTVFPGTTEEVCVPILEKNSGLKFINSNNFKFVKNGFHVGYSPERINPGDKKHKLENIIKITSGSSKKASNFVNALYKKIIKAGTHNVQSIRIAEAAKVIENTQRDLNIAFINELSIIFSKLDIDTQSVLNAASTKWNFLPFKPGFVGGHCISVDPYYLTYKSIQAGYNPKIILAGRKINDEMPNYVFKKISKIISKNFIDSNNINILLMGITFKENCPDYRNSQSLILRKKLIDKSYQVDVFDPLSSKVIKEGNESFKIIKYPNLKKYNAIIFLVAHTQFKNLKIKKIKKNLKKNGFIFDLKYIFDKNEVKYRL